MNIMDAVQSVLAGLARHTDADRLYAFELDGLAAGALTVERWQGWESLSSGFEWWVDLLSTDARLDLDASALPSQPKPVLPRTAVSAGSAARR